MHGDTALAIAHENVPHHAGAQILGHQHGDALVDAEDVGVVQVGGRMKSRAPLAWNSDAIAARYARAPRELRAAEIRDDPRCTAR